MYRYLKIQAGIEYSLPASHQLAEAIDYADEDSKETDERRLVIEAQPDQFVVTSLDVFRRCFSSRPLLYGHIPGQPFFHEDMEANIYSLRVHLEALYNYEASGEQRVAVHLQEVTRCMIEKQGK